MLKLDSSKQKLDTLIKTKKRKVDSLTRKLDSLAIR